MPKEWGATCKDCGAKFGYSDSSYQEAVLRGQSRKERCPECLKLHSRAIHTAGAGYYFDRPPTRTPSSAGGLGKLSHPPRKHEATYRASRREQYQFGITPQNIKEVFDVLREKQVLVVMGPTGSGKSTYLPSCLLSPPEELGLDPDQFTRHGQIVITQPRIQATTKIPEFIASELHGSTLGAGYDVGYKHSGENKSDIGNKLAFITDGTLINWITTGQLNRLSVIMIDEAHERSLNIDLILALLKAQLPRYPHLKLIIASATIDADKFVDYYGGSDCVGLLEFRGIEHNVRVFVKNDRTRREQQSTDDWEAAWDEVDRMHYPKQNAGKPAERIDSNSLVDQLSTTCCALLKRIAAGKKPEGDVLAFLPTVATIEQATSKIRCTLLTDPDLADTDVFPLHAHLSMEEQNLALRSKAESTAARVIGRLSDLANGETVNENVVVLVRSDKILEETANLLQAYAVANDVKQLDIVALTKPETMKDLLESSASGSRARKRTVLITTYENRLVVPEGFGSRIIDRRIIVATNVAETSLTVDGVVYVVDSGLIAQESWDPKLESKSVPMSSHSQAGCKQRWGRAGRILDGEAYGLYTQNEFEQFEPFSIPGIKRTRLESVVLTAKAAGIADVTTFDWLERIDDQSNEALAMEFRRAEDAMKARGALDHDGDLTSLGKEMQSFAAEPLIAELVMTADRYACSTEMCTLVPMLQCNLAGGLLRWNGQWDTVTKNAVRRIHSWLTFSCNDDLELCLKLYQAWREAATWEGGQRAWGDTFMVNVALFDEYIHPEREQLIANLSQRKKEDERRPIDFDLLDRLRIMLALCIPDNCFVRSESYGVYRSDCSASATVEIDEDSVVADQNKWPHAFVAFKRRGSRAPFKASMIASLQQDWLRDLPRQGSPLAVAEFIATATRQSLDAGLITRNARSRLFVDQKYPLDWQFAVEKGIGQGGTPTISIGSLEKRALPVAPRVKPVQEALLLARDGDADKDFRVPSRRNVDLQENSDQDIPPTAEIQSNPRLRLRVVHAAQAAGDLDIIVGMTTLYRRLKPGACTSFLTIDDELSSLEVVFSLVDGDESAVIEGAWRSTDSPTLVVLPGENGVPFRLESLPEPELFSGNEQESMGPTAYVRSFGEWNEQQVLIDGKRMGRRHEPVPLPASLLQVEDLSRSTDSVRAVSSPTFTPGHYYTVIPLNDVTRESRVVVVEDLSSGELMLEDCREPLPIRILSNDVDERVPDSVQVAGYEIGAGGKPTVLAMPVRDDGFDKCADLYAEGDVARVRVVEYCQNEESLWLVVEEIHSGYRTVMESTRVAFSACPPVMAAAAKAREFDVVVEGVDSDRRHMEFSRLPFVEADLVSRIASEGWDGSVHKLDCVGDRAFWTLWPVDEHIGFAHGALARLPVGHDVAKTCTFAATSVRYPDKSIVLLGRAPAGLLRLLRRQPWKSRFEYRADKAQLELNSPMSYAERSLLLAQCDESWYGCAIDDLYYRSNRLNLELAKEQPVEPPTGLVQGSVTDVHPNSAIAYAALGGVEVEVIIQRRGYVGWRETKDVREILRRGELVDLAIVSPTKKGVALTARIIADDDPIRGYAVGQRVVAKVRSMDASGIRVELEHGIGGWIDREQCSWCLVDPRTVASVGQQVDCCILGVNLAKRNLILSRRIEETDPLRNYRPGSIVHGKLLKKTDKGFIVSIGNDESAFLPPFLMAGFPEERLVAGSPLKLSIKGVKDELPRRILIASVRNEPGQV